MNTNQHQKFKKPKQTSKPNIQQSQTKIDKGFIEELTEKVRQQIVRFGPIPLHVQQKLHQQYNKCQQELLDIEDVAQIQQYLDPIHSQICPNIWKIRLRATGNMMERRWLVFPPDYPASWPVFCLCYPKNNNMDRTNDRDKLAFQHENVYQSGEMSIPAFEKDGWELIGPKLLHNFFQIIACIIGHPNPFSPANQKLVENSEESQKLLIQYQLQYLNDYPSKKQ
ncbi:hypothetical protein pb186bvf_002441 [Paramecium bursaria]